MLPSLLMTAAITVPGSPIPKDAVPNTTGPAPRIVAVKSDANGAVWITAQVWEKRKVQQQFLAVENGKQMMKQQEVEQNVSNYIHKAIGDFGAKFSTADGAALSTEEATKRVKDGATLLVTADGKPIDRTWLRAIEGDTVVMQAEGLAHAHFQYNLYSPANSVLPTTASPRLALFCADEAGAVKVAVNPNGGTANGNNIYYEDLGGGQFRGRAVAVQGNFVIDGSSTVLQQGAAKSPVENRKLLSDIKFDAYDTAGKRIPRAEALKRLRAGGLVLLAGDNRFPDAGYLSAFRDDILVLVSGEFVFPAGMPNPYDMPVKTAAAPPGPGMTDPVIRPAPAVRIIAPAAQLRVAPAVVRPAAPAPQLKAKPTDKPAAKPASKGG
jgi:hypothetical protein